MPARLIAVIFLVSACRSVPVEAQILTDGRAWLVVVAQERTGTASPWRWSVDLAARSRDGLDAIDATALRGMVGFDLTARSSVWVGYAWAESRPAAGAVHEHRFFGQFQWRERAAGGIIALRTRIEQRFFEGNTGLSWRLRQQVRFNRPIAAARRLSLVGWNEVLLHANSTGRTQRGLDQNRAFGGVGITIDTHATVEIGYLNQYSRSHSGPHRMNHVLSGTLGLAF